MQAMLEAANKNKKVGSKAGTKLVDESKPLDKQVIMKDMATERMKEQQVSKGCA